MPDPPSTPVTADEVPDAGTNPASNPSSPPQGEFHAAPATATAGSPANPAVEPAAADTEPTAPGTEPANRCIRILERVD